MTELDSDIALDPSRLRLNKFLAERGICSRRDADLWIESGRVTVNGGIADLGDYISDKDQVRVDGELVHAYKKPKRIYIALNKPLGVECTTDQRIDGNIVDFVGHQERIFPIGRLDKDSDGLILLTNDGDIVNKILRAEHHHEKEYWVTVDRKVSAEMLREMAQGVRIMGRMTRPCKTYKMAAQTFGIILTEGMNRQIRRMAEVFGYKVTKLTRVRIMNIALGHLKVGRWRNLNEVELNQLKSSLTQAPAPRAASPRAASPRAAAPRSAERASRTVTAHKPSVNSGTGLATRGKRIAGATKSDVRSRSGANHLADKRKAGKPAAAKTANRPSKATGEQAWTPLAKARSDRPIAAKRATRAQVAEGGSTRTRAQVAEGGSTRTRTQVTEGGSAKARMPTKSAKPFAKPMAKSVLKPAAKPRLSSVNQAPAARKSSLLDEWDS